MTFFPLFLMHRFWDTVIGPAFEILHPRVIVEIGSADGKQTSRVLQYCEANDATLHAIDPMPDFPVEEWMQRHRPHLIVHQNMSLNVLGTIADCDVALIDGDHNWYTIYNELLLLEKRVNHGWNFPVTFLHDIGSPFGRRDAYCDPERIPIAYRKAYAPRETWATSRMPAKNAVMQNKISHALEENDVQNGVLTAVEDFLKQTTLDLSFVSLPGFHGLGIIAPQQLLNQSAAFAMFLKELHVSTAARMHMEQIEQERTQRQTWQEEQIKRVAELEQAERKLYADLSERDGQILQLRQTKSWRWTAPLRSFDALRRRGMAYVAFHVLRVLWTACGSPFRVFARKVRHDWLSRRWPVFLPSSTNQPASSHVSQENRFTGQKVGVQYYVGSNDPIEPAQGTSIIAPLGTADCAPRWEGRITRKPWEYRVSVVIPHLETPDLLPICIELLRLQTERPYILVIDTGSTPETLARLEYLRSADVEIHSIRAHSYRHASEPVAVAQDLAFALCRSEFLFCTHADCFLRRRDYIEWLSTLCNADCPAVGYEMSPRDWITDQWKGMVSHTATLLHMPTMRRLGVMWNLERTHTDFGLARSTQWPDTETCMNLIMRRANIQPLLIGKETNYERHVDENLDHCRSYAGSLLYADEYHRKARSWIDDALNEAHERIAAWRHSPTVHV